MNNTLTQLLNVLETQLGSKIYKSGSVLYSSPDTLKPGQFYFLAFNPGGEPTNDPKETIKAQTENLKEGHNAFLHEDWSTDKRRYDRGKAPHQKNVQALAQLLGVDIQDMFSTELIFLRSRRADGVDYAALSKKCWPVHQWMLGVVKPSIIVSNGNAHGKSAYAYVLNAFRNEGLSVNELSPAPSGHGRFWLKAARVTGHPTVKTVLGIPHLSYYHLISDHTRPIVQAWLDNILNNHSG